MDNTDVKYYQDDQVVLERKPWGSVLVYHGGFFIGVIRRGKLKLNNKDISTEILTKVLTACHAKDVLGHE